MCSLALWSLAYFFWDNLRSHLVDASLFSLDKLFCYGAAFLLCRGIWVVVCEGPVYYTVWLIYLSFIPVNSVVDLSISWVGAPGGTLLSSYSAKETLIKSLIA